MKKKAFLRGLLGIPLGISIGYVITIAISIAAGHSEYFPCVPLMVDAMGSEINAVVLQTLLCAFLGAAFGAASVIWELDHWSIRKQTGIYFLVVSIAMLPVAYATYWMPHSLAGFLVYFGIFTFIFLVIWLLQYFIWKGKIKRINRKLAK